jgi:hypothetical protein
MNGSSILLTWEIFGGNFDFRFNSAKHVERESEI